MAWEVTVIPKSSIQGGCYRHGTCTCRTETGHKPKQPHCLHWLLNFMIRTNQKFEEFDFKASGGRISGTLSYMGKLIGTLADWTRKVINSFSPLEFQMRVKFGCTFLQWVKKMVQMSSAVLESRCACTESCTVGLVSAGWEGMQSGKQTTFPVLRRQLRGCCCEWLSSNPPVTTHGPLCHTLLGQAC